MNIDNIQTIMEYDSDINNPENLLNKLNYDFTEFERILNLCYPKMNQKTIETAIYLFPTDYMFNNILFSIIKSQDNLKNTIYMLATNISELKTEVMYLEGKCCYLENRIDKTNCDNFP